MHTPQLFSDLLIILLVSVPAAFLCLRLKLPVLVGLMVTGIAIGPYGLRLVSDLAGIEVLAEVGVMLLLFTIGLEFSLGRLREMKRLVLLGGGLQVIVTIALVTLVSTFLGRGTGQSIFFGFLVALSSTAIVLKTYVDRKEIDAPHGRAGIGILLFQDISIVIMLLLVPMLGGDDIVSFAQIALDLGTSLLALVAIVAGAWFLLPKILKQVVALRSPELFLLTVVLFALGISWITSHYGMSLALGAFIAGMVIADSDYAHQATAEILPFRDVFNSLFFVSIGMLLSFTSLIENAVAVVEILALVLVGKGLIIWAVIRLMGSPQRVAIMTAMGLAQIGEFSFVLARAGQSTQLFTGTDYQNFLAASIISMIATPFLIAAAPKVGYFVQSYLKDGGSGDVGNMEDDDIHLTSSGGLNKHVIMVGYGLNGKNLSRVLRGVGIPYTILDVNAEVVRRAKEKGEKINFGDATRREVLLHAKIEDAFALVLAMSDAQAARRTVNQARRMSKTLHIIVRTRYVSEIGELYDLGANEVIPEEFETSIEIFSRVLHRYGFSRQVIEGQIDRIRKQGYEMLRSTAPPPQAQISNINPALDTASTETIQLIAGSPAIGKTLGQLDLRGETGATVIAVVRDGNSKVSPGANYALAEDDTVILVGTPKKLQRAIELFTPGGASDGFNA
jgi:monovalent cation:H+ antiporter-2, CPA2 family